MASKTGTASNHFVVARGCSCFGAFVISPNRFHLDFLVIDWKAAVIMLSADMVMKETARRMWWRPASGGRSSFS